MVATNEQTYSKLSDNPESIIDPEQEARKCQGRIAGLFFFAFIVSIVGFVCLVLPIMAGVCTIHTKAVCNVTGSVLTYNSLSEQTHRTFPANETVCYITDNGLVGKTINLNVFDDIVMNRCFVWVLLGFIFDGSLILVVCVFAVIWGLSEMAKLRCCQRLGSAVMPMVSV